MWLHVCFGSEADITAEMELVRFVPLADISADERQANALVVKVSKKWQLSVCICGDGSRVAGKPANLILGCCWLLLA
jgi:hypothetical protein